MNKNRNELLTKEAQTLRKEMTEAEKLLWYNFLRELPVSVKRQKIIENYIVDFYCASKKLIIEVDGEYHEKEYFRIKDKKREEFLKEKGFKLIRFTNKEIVNNFEKVCKFLEKEFDIPKE